VYKGTDPEVFPPVKIDGNSHGCLQSRNWDYLPPRACPLSKGTIGGKSIYLKFSITGHFGMLYVLRTDFPIEGKGDYGQKSPWNPKKLKGYGLTFHLPIHHGLTVSFLLLFNYLKCSVCPIQI
jgi:hypothetical protein